MLYYEDIPLNEVFDFGTIKVTKEEVIAFAKEWDPQPFHIDEEAAKHSIYGGLTASSIHIFALMGKLSTLNGPGISYVGSLSVTHTIPNPLRADSVLSGKYWVVEKRVSNSRPTVGLIKQRFVLSDEDGKVVLDVEGMAMVNRRPTAA